MVLLVQLLTWSPAATFPLALRTTRAANITAVTVDKHTRDNDPISEILIEHVGEDEAVMLPLLIGLLVLGALIFLSLLLLGCLLVLRLCESDSAKYHRLRSEDSESHRHRSKTKRSRQSQVFTYVDLSNADCSCREHAAEGQRQAPAPRFGVQFQTASKLEVNDAHKPRERQGAPSPAPRKSRMAGMGLPSGEDDADTQPERRPTSAESDINPSGSTNAPVHGTGEQPTKGVSVQSPVGIPLSHGGSVNEGDEFDTYRERCTQFRSVIPQLEINVRDRLVKRHASSAAGGRMPPGRTRIDHEAESSVTAQTTESAYAFHPDLHISPQTEVDSHGGYDMSSDIQLSPLFSPGTLSVSSPYLQNRPRTRRPGDSTSEHTSPFRAETTDVFGHGRYYEEHAGSQMGKTETSQVTARRHSEVNSAPKGRQPVSVTSPGRIRHPGSALVEFPDNRIAARDDSSSVTSSDSTRFQELFGNEAAKARQAIVPVQNIAEESKPPVAPMGINTNVYLHRIPLTRPSAIHSPYQSPSREMSAQVPQTAAYLDLPETAKSLEATAYEKPEDGMMDRSSSSEGPQRTHPVAEASVSNSLTERKERTLSTNEKLRLPQPPMQRVRYDLQSKLSDDQSAVISGSLPSSVRKRRDDRSSTEPFSVDELSHHKASASDPFSEIDASSGPAYVKKDTAVAPFVHPRSKSFALPVLPSTASVSAADDGRLGLGASSEEHAKEGRGLSLRVEGDQDVEARTDSAPLIMEKGAQPLGKVVAREEPSVTSSALVKSVDTLESRKHTSPGATSYVQEVPSSAVSASTYAPDYSAQPIAAREGSLIQSSAQHDTLAETRSSGKAATRSGDNEAGGKQSALPVPAQDKEVTGKNSTAPGELNAETDEGSLTPKEPLVFPSGSESEEAAGSLEAYDTKKKSLSDAAPPYAADLWTPFKVLSKKDREALASLNQEHGTSILPAQVPQKQLVISKEELLIRGRDTTLPTVDTEAQSGALEEQVIPEKQTLLFDDDVDQESGAAGSFAASSVGNRGGILSVPPSTRQPPVPHDATTQMIPHTSVPDHQIEKGTAITGRHDHIVPGEEKGGQLSDVASADEKQISINENKEAMERGPGGSSGELATKERRGVPMSSIGSEEQVERYEENGKSLSKALQPSTTLQLTSLPHTDKLTSREEHNIPASRGTKQEIWANVPQAPPVDRQAASENGVALPDQTEAYPRPSATAAQPKPEGNAIFVRQSQLSDQSGKESRALEDAAKPTLGERLTEDAITTTKRPPVTSSPPPQMLLFGPQPTFWDFTKNDSIISRQEYTVPGEMTGGLFSDVVSAEDNQITRDEKKVPTLRGRSTAAAPLNDVVPAEDKPITSDEKREPMARRRDTEIERFNDVASAEDKQLTSDRNRVPMDRSRDAVANRSNDVVSAEDKQIARDEKVERRAEDRVTAAAPFNDLASAEDKQITSDGNRVPMERSHDAVTDRSNDAVSAEDKHIARDEKIEPRAEDRVTAAAPFNDVDSAEDKQINRVPMERIRHDAVTDRSDHVVSAEDKQVARDEKVQRRTEDRVTSAAPFNDVVSAEDKQITSDRNRVPMERSHDAVTDRSNDVVSAEDKQIARDEKVERRAEDRVTAAAPFNDLASAEDKQITSDGNRVPMEQSHDAVTDRSNDAVSAEDKHIARDEKIEPRAEDRVTAAAPFNDVDSAEDKQINRVPMERIRHDAVTDRSDHVVSAEDKQVARDEKVQRRTEDRVTSAAPFNDVVSAEDKQITSDGNRVPMERSHDDVTDRSNDVVSAEDKQIARDEKVERRAEDRVTAAAPFNDVAFAEDKQISSEENMVPMERSHDDVTDRSRDVVSAEDKQVARDEKKVLMPQGHDATVVSINENKQITTAEKREPVARGSDTAAAPFSDIVSEEDKQIIGNERKDTVERDLNTGAGNLVAEESLEVQPSTPGVLGPRTPCEGENRSLSEAAAPSASEQRSPFPKNGGLVLSREEIEVPADRAQKLDAVTRQTNEPDKQVAPDIGTNSPGAAAEEQVIPVTLPVTRSPPMSYLDDEEFRAPDSASEPSVTEFVAPSQQRPPVTSAPPPQMLLHGPLPPVWDDKNSALTTRQEYTVPGETTGGPFSASERRLTDDFGSPESSEPRFSEDRRAAAKGAKSTEQTENVFKAAKRRSSWADSSQSQLQPPNLARSSHSSVDISPPAYGDLTHTTLWCCHCACSAAFIHNIAQY
ncbi:hypothetical protein V5799_013615 [Amblyomma americanum]|uniref:Uncharacterized protein n=1 Tax=Amblyomma americanum TaxID=6943 RepID=A0AAQ4E5F6_AMBAM